MNLEDLAVQAAETDARSKSNTKRLDRLEHTVEAIHELAQNVAVLAESQRDVKSDVEEIKKDVQGLKAVPAKRWESFIEKVVFGLICTGLGALVTLTITKLF